MSASPKAVFLSYASQDAEAARRICDALRAAGVDVWFDQSALRGGDAWDASIRRQIKECALFVPVISANTENRTEGYFRLEWRLAEQRSHLMAKGRPFILPVVIDSTSDAQAHVPDAFLEVQWSQLPDGQSDETFAARLQQLLSGEVMRPAGAGTTAAPAPGSAADLVTKARDLLGDPLLTRRNVELALQLSLEAIARDPINAEAFAVAAWANFTFLTANYEDTPKQRADLRDYAEKAQLLAPDSTDAELAMCGVLAATKNLPEAITRLRSLADRAPNNLAVLRTLAWLGVISARGDPLRAGTLWSTTSDDHLILLSRLRALSPLGRSYADTFLAAMHWGRGEYGEADRLIDGVFASGIPVTATYLTRLLVLIYGWGDLAAARNFVAEMPSKLLLEDVFVTHVSKLWAWSGDHEQALRTLNRTQREILHEALIEIPTAMLRGDVYAAAGKPAAAAIQWREALKIVDRLLQANPDNIRAHENRARLLVLLGDLQAAADQHALVLEISPQAVGSISWARDFEFRLLTGDTDGGIARLERLVALDNGRWPNFYNILRHDPSLLGLRNDPRVQGMLARGAEWLEHLRQTEGSKDGSGIR